MSKQLAINDIQMDSRWSDELKSDSDKHQTKLATFLWIKMSLRNSNKQPTGPKLSGEIRLKWKRKKKYKKIEKEETKVKIKREMILTLFWAATEAVEVSNSKIATPTLVSTPPNRFKFSKKKKRNFSDGEVSVNLRLWGWLWIIRMIFCWEFEATFIDRIEGTTSSKMPCWDSKKNTIK